MNTQNDPAIELNLFIRDSACDMTSNTYVPVLFSLCHKHHFILLAELEQQSN